MQVIPLVAGLLQIVDLICIFRKSGQCIEDQSADAIAIMVDEKKIRVRFEKWASS